MIMRCYIPHQESCFEKSVDLPFILGMPVEDYTGCAIAMLVFKVVVAGDDKEKIIMHSLSCRVP